MINVEIIRGAILGHAVGDALGVPAEFIPREKLQKNPVIDMLGYGSHNVPKVLGLMTPQWNYALLPVLLLREKLI